MIDFDLLVPVILFNQIAKNQMGDQGSGLVFLKRNHSVLAAHHHHHQQQPINNNSLAK